MERATGIEPASEAWEASILPMNYARNSSSRRNRPVDHIVTPDGRATGVAWVWRGSAGGGCGDAWREGVGSAWVATYGGEGRGGVRSAQVAASPGTQPQYHPPAPACPIHWARPTDWSSHASSRGGGRDR